MGRPGPPPPGLFPHFFPPPPAGTTPVVDGKLYFSTGDSAAYFDLSAGTFTALEDLPQRLEALFPGAGAGGEHRWRGRFPLQNPWGHRRVAIFAFLYEGRNVWVALGMSRCWGCWNSPWRTTPSPAMTARSSRPVK